MYVDFDGTIRLSDTTDFLLELFALPAWRVVGDGRSDFCIATRADLVPTKPKLIEECRSAGIPHLPLAASTRWRQLLESWRSAGSIPGHATDHIPLEA